MKIIFIWINICVLEGWKGLEKWVILLKALYSNLLWGHNDITTCSSTQCVPGTETSVWVTLCTVKPRINDATWGRITKSHRGPSWTEQPLTLDRKSSAHADMCHVYWIKVSFTQQMEITGNTQHTVSNWYQYSTFRPSAESPTDPPRFHSSSDQGDEKSGFEISKCGFSRNVKTHSTWIIDLKQQEKSSWQKCIVLLTIFVLNQGLTLVNS